MASLLRSTLVFAFASSLIVLAVPACSEQGEGERCDRAKAGGDSECDSGLICVPQSELLEELTDLCCPPEGQESTERCTRKGSSGTAGSSNGGSNSSGNGAGGSAGESLGGMPSDGGTGAVAGDTGSAGEPTAGGSPSSEGGAPTAAGGESSAGAPLASGGQAGSPL
jgi:hypothetical protein